MELPRRRGGTACGGGPRRLGASAGESSGEASPLTMTAVGMHGRLPCVTGCVRGHASHGLTCVSKNPTWAKVRLTSLWICSNMALSRWYVSQALLLAE
jgi:hypothetical protein